MTIARHVTRIASITAPAPAELGVGDFEGVDESPVRCLDAEAEAAMVEEINRLRKENESLGGSFEVRAFGLVPGLGAHISWEERLDGRIAQQRSHQVDQGRQYRARLGGGRLEGLRRPR